MLELWSDISDVVSETGANPGGRQVDTVQVRGNVADADTTVRAPVVSEPSWAKGDYLMLSYLIL